jgi:hypothetical protein
MVNSSLFRKQKRLARQLGRNFNEYRCTMLKTNRQAIFEKAYEIAAYQITYSHMRHISQYDEQSLDYLLKFQNPLQMVADHYMQDIRVDLSAIIARICDTQDLLNDYPLMPDQQRHGPER